MYVEKNGSECALGPDMKMLNFCSKKEWLGIKCLTKFRIFLCTKVFFKVYFFLEHVKDVNTCENCCHIALGQIVYKLYHHLSL